jgi:hypothetical protein
MALYRLGGGLEAAHTRGVEPLALTASDPPTQAEMQAIPDKLDEVIAALNTE